MEITLYVKGNGNRLSNIEKRLKLLCKDWQDYTLVKFELTTSFVRPLVNPLP